MENYIKKAEVLSEALPYMLRFRGETVVVKFGGSIMENEDGVKSILQDIAFMECVGMHPIVVHGGGKAISKALKEKGIFSKFVQGLRVTDSSSIKIVERVLNQEINPYLVDTLLKFNGKARGIHGEDIFKVDQLTSHDFDEGERINWGYVGNILSVDTEPIDAFTKSDIISLITPLGKDEKGQIYNINADEAATHLACALKARKLVFLSDVPGLLRDQEDINSLISTLHLHQVEELIKLGVISGGMLPKIKGMANAVKKGVKKAHIIDSSIPHSLLLELFTNEGIGTEILK